MTTLKKLYLFTGKGGVGKTTLSLAFCHYLSQSLHQKVTYFSFAPIQTTSILNDFKIPYYELNPHKSINEYIKKKLGVIAGDWITETSFFKALIEILPSIAYLISLGQIIEKWKESPDRVAVFDAPSSGHAMVMFESLKNFKDIFKSGIIFNDILDITEKIFNQNFTKTMVVTLPLEMSMQESLELKEQMISLGQKHPSIILNNLISLSPCQKERLPLYFQNKWEAELKLIDENREKIDIYVPQMAFQDYKETLTHLATQMAQIL